MRNMVKDHTQDVAEFRREATSKDPSVKEFAEKTLPNDNQNLVVPASTAYVS